MRTNLLARLRLRRRVAGVVMAASCLAGLTLVVSTPAVHAYPPVNDVVTVTASCTTTTAGHDCTVTATVTDPNGNRVADITVQWSVSGTNADPADPGCGSVSPGSGVTNAQGQTSTTFTPGDTCCTATRITATAPSINASGSTVIDVTCGGVLGISTGAPAGGLPNTSGSPGGSGQTPWGALGLMLGGLATVLAAGVFLTRTRRQTPVI